MDIDVTVESHKDEIMTAMRSALDRALEAVGLQAEGYAKMYCPVDTGRLRNSITHSRDEEAAYISTNVEYAPYVEYGTTKTKPQPFLRPAAEGHTEEYKEIFESYCKNA